MAAPFCIRFSGITVRFMPPDAPMKLSAELEALLCPDTQDADTEYTIQLLHQPLELPPAPFYKNAGITVYQTREGLLRIHPLRPGGDGSQVACLLRPDQKNTLYYPAELWEHYATPLHCAHLLALERVLLDRNAFLLHSSVVMLGGKAVLFCGPSGQGKSTQAELWKTHLGADILNGDRCVVMERDSCFYGGGSPLAGSSRIYRREQAPIAAIFLPEKADETAVQRLGLNALAPLLGQTLLNSWDTDFMQRLTELLSSLLEQVPIYRLSCRPDREAVEAAYRTAFPTRTKTVNSCLKDKLTTAD